mgnify:CR=1 FL=1
MTLLAFLVLVAPATSAPPPAATGPWAFTPAQVRTLRANGWRGARWDQQAATVLHRRGFSAADYVQAYRDVTQHLKGWTRFVVAAAVWRTLDTPWKKLRSWASGTRSLTAHYNITVIGGLGMEITGWLIGGVFGGALIVSGVGIALSPLGYRASDDGTGYGPGIYAAAGIVGGIGILLAAIGVPIGAVATHRRRKRWLRPGTLARATKAELRSIRLRRQLRRTPRKTAWSVQPHFGRSAGGVGFTLRF